jgi:hypothetical protein
VTYDATAILQSAMPQITSLITDDTVIIEGSVDKMKRAATACAPQPTGAGPIPSPDTASAFLDYAVFKSAASSAPVPIRYSQMFTNLQASNNAYGYMGNSTLKTYGMPALLEVFDVILLRLHILARIQDNLLTGVQM